MSELKPCPFCGNKAVELMRFQESPHRITYLVRCVTLEDLTYEPDFDFDFPEPKDNSCGYIESHGKQALKKDAISYWNTRPIEDALRSEIDRLKEDLANAKDELKHRRDAIVDAQNIYNGTYLDSETSTGVKDPPAEHWKSQACIATKRMLELTAFLRKIMLLGLLRGSPRLRDEALRILDGFEASTIEGSDAQDIGGE